MAIWLDRNPTGNLPGYTLEGVTTNYNAQVSLTDGPEVDPADPANWLESLDLVPFLPQPPYSATNYYIPRPVLSLFQTSFNRAGVAHRGLSTGLTRAPFRWPQMDRDFLAHGGATVEAYGNLNPTGLRVIRHEYFAGIVTSPDGSTAGALAAIPGTWSDRWVNTPFPVNEATWNPGDPRDYHVGAANIGDVELTGSVQVALLGVLPETDEQAHVLSSLNVSAKATADQSVRVDCSEMVRKYIDQSSNYVAFELALYSGDAIEDVVTNGWGEWILAAAPEPTWTHYPDWPNLANGLWLPSGVQEYYTVHWASMEISNIGVTYGGSPSLPAKARLMDVVPVRQD